jgi:hypothetical protein
VHITRLVDLENFAGRLRRGGLQRPEISHFILDVL